MQAIKKRFKKATATPKARIITLSIFFFLLAAICGGLWYWNTHKKAIITKKIETAVSRKSQGLYKIKYDSLELDEIAGRLSFSNMKINYDTGMYLKAEQTGNLPPLLVSIQIPEITLTGLKTPRALIQNEIVGRKVVIKNPVIDIQYTYKGKEAARNTPTTEIYKQILGDLDLINLDTVLITGAQINTSSRRTGKIRMKDMTISLIDFKVDSTGNADNSRFLFAKLFNIDCKKIYWSSSNKLYNYNAENISLNSISRNLLIGNFSIKPTLGEDAFVNALPTQDDRLDFSFNKISFGRIDLQKFMNENLVAATMKVSTASCNVYRDLAIPRDKKNRVGYYPHQVMGNIPFLFSISKAFFSNAFVEYKERNHITRLPGKVQFYNLNATFTNFTNDNATIAAKNVMTADVNTQFLNKTPLKATWTFYLLHPKGRFDVKGDMGPIDATLLNPLTEPMGPAHIKEGLMNGLQYDLQGHDYGMNGTVQLLYKDLKVAILEKDKGATETDKKFLTSLFANLTIKNSNPKGNDDIRVAQVNFDRDINRSIFHLYWKTLFKGIRETMGIKK